MADIVERLQLDAKAWRMAGRTCTGPFVAALEEEAAAEIERLRAALRLARSGLIDARDTTFMPHTFADTMAVIDAALNEQPTAAADKIIGWDDRAGVWRELSEDEQEGSQG